MSLNQIFTNNSRCGLGAALSNVATTLTFETGKGALFASPTGSGFQLLTISEASVGVEIVKMTTRSVDSASVIVRAQESTTALTFTTAAEIYAGQTAGTFQEVNDSQNYFFSDYLNFNVASDNVFDFVAPTGMRFYCDECGIIVDDADSVVAAPFVSFGTAAATESILASAQTTATTPDSRQIFSSLLTFSNQPDISASIKTAANSAWFFGRLYFRGFILQ